MFISVVHTLLSHPIPSIRRRAMELLSAKLQHQSNFFSLAQDQSILLELIPSLTAIASGQGSSEEAALNQQTAFFTLKLLCLCMGPSASSSFRPVLDVIVEIISLTKTTSYTVLASFLQALAPKRSAAPTPKATL
jgi:U3 small nucleolar RNA-associated protein 10